MSKFIDFFNLHQGEEKREKVYDNVISGISFRGSNLWILACAIVVASVGLNVNSTAVVIGAMLISPLMGPIVGMGFSLATYDFKLLKKSIVNLLIATLVGLIVSFVYFLISPFKDIQSELIARTYPTFYDVIIAFFGGLVGVIALTRVEKGNPIPGVAIATALMPPLCTAGYGLAVMNFSFFAGAIYLYIINCFFICISTFFIIKMLKYPTVEYIDKKSEKIIHNTISILIILMIIPSFYLAYNLYMEKQFTQNVERYINSEFTKKNSIVIYTKMNYNVKPKTIELAILNNRYSNQEVALLNSNLKKYNIYDTKLILKQDSIDLRDELMTEVHKQQVVFKQKDSIISIQKQKINQYEFDNFQILKEVKILFPEINDISINNHNVLVSNDSIIKKLYVVYSSKRNLNKNQETLLMNWLNEKLQKNNIEIIYKR